MKNVEENHLRMDSMNTTQRIVVLDVLRGFALMGLFLIHVIELFELYWVNPQPNAIRSTLVFLFSGKAYGLFAFLFGLSYYMLCEQASKNPYSASLYTKRMLVLLIFGYIHSLIYPGDILQQLAIGGLVLLAIARLPNWALWGLILLCLGQVFTTIQFLLLFPIESYTQPLFWDWSGLNQAVYQNESFLNFLAHTAWTGQVAKYVLVPETGSHWHILGLFILGLQMGRIGVFTKPITSKTLYVALTITTTLAAVFYLILKWGGEAFPEYLPRWGFHIVVGRAFNISLIAFYIATAMLLVRHPTMRSMLSPFAATGRMSLTLYMGQSFVVVPLLYGFGFGLWDDLSQPQVFALGILLWTLQLAGATIWFKYYCYGPFEWIWRTITFGNFKLPLKR